MNWLMQQNQREYEQQIYDQRYSMQGQINQMQQAGLNPALMYGGVGTTASQGGAVDQSAEGPEHTPASSPTDRLNSFISLFSQLFGLGTKVAESVNNIKSGKSQRDLNEKTGNLTDAEVDTERARKLNVEADTRNKDANTDYTKNQQILNSLMAVLDRRLKRGQIAEQDWRVQSAALDYAFSSESYEDRLETIVLENKNLKATNDLLKAQESETWSRIPLNEANEALARANKELTDYMVTQEGLNTETRQYAQDNGLPYDQPVVVMTHQRLSEALADAMIDAQQGDKQAKSAVASLTKAIAQIEANAERTAEGKMTRAEKTRFWAEQTQKLIGQLGQAASIYLAGRAAGKGLSSRSVETVTTQTTPDLMNPNGAPKVTTIRDS